jgi:peptidyl-tRNA hydrolase, PTH1 family
MKVILGLGNPGPRYDATRHNVGWWAADRLSYDWGLGAFRQEGPALVADGTVEGEEVILLKPTTYMNRSGVALRPFLGREGFHVSSDLLVLVDDATLDVGRVRLRPRGSAGGHNGLKSVQSVLGHADYSRLRIGVGRPPEGADLVDWVLSTMQDEDEERVLELLPELTEAIGVWIAEGIEPAMNRINR